MKSLRRLLLLEDNSFDAELIRRIISGEWPECELTIVSTEGDFRSALEGRVFDLVLSDYLIPGFHGLAALTFVRKRYPDMPFLFVSGAIGDEVAIESLKAGATDYVLKDRLSRLIPVIRRALNENEESTRRKQAEERLRLSEEQYRDLFENATDLIQSVTPDGHFLYVNHAWRVKLGYTESEITDLTILDIIHPSYHEQWHDWLQMAHPDEMPRAWEVIFLTKSGRQLYVEGNLSLRFVSGKLVAIRGIFHDMTEKKLAAISLQRSIRQYEALVNSVDGIVWQADFPSLRFTFVSQQAERLLGYPIQSWLEDPCFWQSHIHPEDREKAVAVFAQLSTDHACQNFEYRMQAADGHTVWLRDIISLRSEKGQTAQIQGIMVDVTSRKKAEAARLISEALKGAILEAALDCIVVVNHEGHIIEFNPAAERTFGYSRSEILGQPMAEKIIPPALRGFHYQGMKQYLASGDERVLGRRIEVSALRADGSEFPVELAILPIETGDRPVFTAYLRDITERKRSEEKVRRIQAELEQTNKDLLRRSQEIQNFYHTLSHELKTPLTSAREFVSLVMDGIAGPLNQTQSEYLGIAKQSCDQLRVCINDLLDTTRLETGKLALDLKSASLDSLVQRVVTALRRVAAEKEISLMAEIQRHLPRVALDENRITQVIINLLNNAIKYTPNGGRITIRVGEALDQPELIQISISDTGRGIPKEELDHIFDRLYQVKTGDATTEQGIGLGLYLCRELVQLHGGNIWVESEPGKGSTFSFVIPKSQQILNSNLLIIDDDPVVLEMLSQLLTDEQYNVRIARDGAEGLEEMRRQAPDVVVMDLAMPALDGPATLREIRKDWGSIPVIVHTAQPDGDLMKQAMAFSPFTLLAKPSRPEQILETVRKVQRSTDTVIWTRNHFGLRKPPTTSKTA
jgi:PAS domain S-box-containing protein